LAGVIVACLLLCPAAEGAVSNGRIAVGTDGGTYPGDLSSGVFTLNPDGSGVQALPATDSHERYQGLSYSPGGRWIAASLGGLESGRLILISADGTRTRLLPHKRYRGRGPEFFSDKEPFFSPDGKRIVFLRTAPKPHLVDLFEINLDGSHLRRLTRGHGGENNPEFSPDGRHIVFDRDVAPGATTQIPYNVAPGFELIQMRSDGTRVRRLTHDLFHDEAPTYSPDGRSIVWSRNSDGNDGILWEMKSTGGSPHPLMPLNRGATDPEFSPDGRWIVFEDYNEPPPIELGIIPAGGGTPAQIPHVGIQGPIDPTWQPLRGP
jgi:TolB protein